MILYEYPLNESIRALLRLEDVLNRFEHFRHGEDQHDHVQAVALLFDLVDLFSRTDSRAELLNQLERQRRSLTEFRNSPDVSADALERMLVEVYGCHERLSAAAVNPGQAVRNNEWLMSVRSRILIAGGAADYDMPSFWAWQNSPLEQRKRSFDEWLGPFEPLINGLRLALRLLRESGKAMSMKASDGSCQHALGAQNFQMAQLRVEPSLGAVPEISANKYLLWIRFNHFDRHTRPRPLERAVPFQLTLCKL
jgi:cell division protein ZapD